MPIEINGKKFLYAKDVAAMNGVDPNNVTLRCRSGAVPGVMRAGNTWLIPEDVAQKLIFYPEKAAIKHRLVTSAEWGAMAAQIDADAAYSARYIAKVFNVTQHSVAKHIKEGGLPAQKSDDGYHWQVKGADAITFFKKQFNIAAD